MPTAPVSILPEPSAGSSPGAPVSMLAEPSAGGPPSAPAGVVSEPGANGAVTLTITGTTPAMPVLTEAGVLFGYPLYTQDGTSAASQPRSYFDGAAWVIYHSDGNLWGSEIQAVPTPNLATGWTPGGSASGTPTVVLGFSGTQAPEAIIPEPSAGSSPSSPPAILAEPSAGSPPATPLAIIPEPGAGSPPVAPPAILAEPSAGSAPAAPAAAVPEVAGSGTPARPASVLPPPNVPATALTDAGVPLTDGGAFLTDP